MLAVATVVGASISYTRSDIAYSAVMIWAFAGIAIKHQATPVVSNAAWIAVAVTAMLMISGAYRNRQAPADSELTT
jgi:hypothetical protein